MRAYAGVDWSASKAVIVAAGETGESKERAEVSTCLEDVRAAVEAISTRFGADEVLVFIEAGATLWIRLFAEAGAIVHAVDPKQAKRFAESLGSSGAKDDWRDAEGLLEFGRSARHRPEPWSPPSEATERVTRLSARRDRAVDERTRVMQRLRDDVRRTMPLVDDTIESFELKWARALVRRAPTALHLADVSAAELATILAGAKAKTIARVLAAVQRTTAPWLTPSVAADDADAIWQGLDNLERLDDQIAGIENTLDEVLSTLPIAAQLGTVSGIGQQLTVALIVFGLLGTGDRDAAAVRMGAAPVFKGSGTRADGRPKGHAWMRKTAPARARQATYLIGRLTVMHHPWARQQFAAARARGKNAATAYRQVTRSLLRILHAMVRDGTDYDAGRYTNALTLRGVTRPEPASKARLGPPPHAQI